MLSRMKVIAGAVLAAMWFASPPVPAQEPPAPADLGALTVVLEDVHGVLHTGSTDSANPMVVETPLGEGIVHFGRALTLEEFEYVWWTLLTPGGAFQYINPFDINVAPDRSWVQILEFENLRPWDDIFGPGDLSVDPSWFEPHEAFFHFKHTFTGITWMGSACEPLGINDPTDWICYGQGLTGKDTSDPPTSYELLPACPNPVESDGVVQIRFDVPESSEVWILVIDIEGNVVRTLVDGNFDAGHYSVHWDLLDGVGLPVPLGIYHVLWDKGWVLICSGDIQITEGSSSVDQTILSPPVVITTAPNPFTKPAGANITFRVQEPMKIALSIHDVAGRRIRTLLTPQDVMAGVHSTIWVGNDMNNEPVTGGVYFVRLEAGGRIWTKRIILLR
ncbi:MAG: T9SS type A sorting domain-containing protein [Candidatus Eisenbacteria bacterium]|uniref:T9SS type A sorting domain-containing protein n=1 Tax=Eiseniibacteriota bacterium TaxID=2212470 RepID=A0A948WBK1_UNCEI|nr:T9SS type A sorting domain-containing protein [Candidatus Eisenbacteria bacterium]MBU1951009.1 T9SS type A sorting domain-containing protein [Candidatus Eisenbacteria bacterium]MBU2690038.1 T9SS type A sorting domain-containing protein [Candidatus Eisenbacteria bacterium]